MEDAMKKEYQTIEVSKMKKYMALKFIFRGTVNNPNVIILQLFKKNTFLRYCQ